MYPSSPFTYALTIAVAELVPESTGKSQADEKARRIRDDTGHGYRRGLEQ